MARYLVVVEKDEEDTYVASVPDLPGCRAVGDSHAQAITRVKLAIQLYLASLKDKNKPAPAPTAKVEEIEV